MKKIFIAFAAFAAAFSLVSCNKEQMTEPTSSDIRLNITVEGLDGSADTKAAKTDWVAGDRINLFFQGWNLAGTASTLSPDMVIEYDGVKWAKVSVASDLQERLSSTGGCFSVLYEGNNDISANKYSFQKYSWSGKNEYKGIYFYPQKSTFNGNTVYHNPLVASSEKISYTYDAGSKILTATIRSAGWNIHTPEKILVKNDNGRMNLSADKCYLQVKLLNLDTKLDVWGSFLVRRTGLDCPSIHSSMEWGDSLAGGVQEADGIAFYFGYWQTGTTDIEFRLLKEGDDYNAETGSSAGLFYRSNGREKPSGKMRNIALNYSQFSVKN